MFRLGVISAFLIFLAACTHNPIPEGYTGPVAMVADSYSQRSGVSADFFVLSAINDRQIDDSIVGTRMANHGQGFAQTPVALSRSIPAQPAKFTLKGRRQYGAPILELLNKIYEITGDIEFTPEPNARYVVKGSLSEEYSAVWLENSATGEVVVKKLEIRGSTALGILQK
ncbi:hypothetical protein [Ferrovibrio sp.]|uniref:hypothetical protein n=1 Tax=Ferrovibrio sp. TaxID=1917215 RepID=UPI001B684D64|nr:hypothetical protein [Ferrovibrio sp.]MBP7064048.1 hypothetical protein [Ferrovibrio sp.]